MDILTETLTWQWQHTTTSEGNVGKWLKTKGNLPTDMFVESIPFRETRHYVKRVLGTYQAYHLLYDQEDDTAVFTDLQSLTT